MKTRTPSIRIEPRWPGALAVVAVLVLVSLLPGRLSLFPAWLPLLYWQLDRGGPGSRENLDNVRPDWRFAQAEAIEGAGLESSISLMTMVFVASRAINLLGS